MNTAGFTLRSAHIGIRWRDPDGRLDPDGLLANPTQALADYRRKYLENILPVKPGGFPSLQEMFAAQGDYTLLDNHELGNAQFISGGAPPGNPSGKGTDAADPANDVNSSCSFINRTPGFAALLRAYLDFQPLRERRVTAPADCRTDGTWQLYFAQRWGANSIFINVDDRSYRDIQLKKLGGGDDTGARANTPRRTMLGATQFAWLERTLMEAQKKRVTWKIVAISSPIEQVGPFGPVFPWDGPKTWIGGYRAERNRLLKFIADNHIEHVVFLTTDDHLNRVHDLEYLGVPGDAKTRTPVPGAFTIVAGPIGALAPDRFIAHDFGSVKSVADKLAADERAFGIRPIGLPANFPGLNNVYREGHPDADAIRARRFLLSGHLQLRDARDQRRWQDARRRYLGHKFLSPPTAFPNRTRLACRDVSLAFGLRQIERHDRTTATGASTRRQVRCGLPLVPTFVADGARRNSPSRSRPTSTLITCRSGARRGGGRANA